MRFVATFAPLKGWSASTTIVVGAIDVEAYELILLDVVVAIAHVVVLRVRVIAVAGPPVTPMKPDHYHHFNPVV